MLRDLGDLPPTLDTAQASRLLGVSKDLLWRLAREGTAPVEPLRLGSTLRWPTARLAAVLGVDPRTATERSTEPEDAAS